MIVGGDTPEQSDHFINPTIVRDIADATRLVDKEQFGRVLPVIQYREVEGAVARVNASPYGPGDSNLFDIGTELGEAGLAEFSQPPVINNVRWSRRQKLRRQYCSHCGL